MLLYLVRHAEAVTEEENPARPLSSHGRRQIEEIAMHLHGGRTFVPEIIWHSPLVRARETAELLANAVGLKAPLKEVSDLQPEDDPGTIIDRLPLNGPPLALVGHQPHLGLLASLLVHGPTQPLAIGLEKGEIVLLSGPQSNARWQLLWRLAPRQ